jgi:DNA polymerase I-like protein with 3'-5' exonuclease and polymerase domains
MKPKIYGLDLETAGRGVGYGLQPWRVKTNDSWVTLLATGELQDRTAETVAWPKMQDAERFLERALGCEVVGWNVSFDIAWLLAMGVNRDLIYHTQWRDGMLLAKRVDNNRKQLEREEFKQFKGNKYGLKQMVKERVPELANYEEDVVYHVDKGSKVPEELETYARYDIILTLKIYEELMAEADQVQRDGFILDCQGLPLVAEAWLDGIQVDSVRCSTLKARSQATMGRLERNLGIDAKTMGSTKKLPALLFDRWDLPVIKHTDGGNRSADKSVLKQLAIQDPRVAQIQEWRDQKTKLTKFSSSPLESANYNGGTTHPNPRLVGTYTGRMTYDSKTTVRGEGVREGTTKWHKLPTGVALHQWQNDPAVRGVLTPPKGYMLAEWDWAGQEMRLMADYSGDANMLRLFNESLDGHSWMACQIYQLDYDEFVKNKDDKKRKLGKLANLSLQYRTGAKKLREKAFSDYNLVISIMEAEAIISGYHRAYDQVKPYQARAIRLARDRGYAATRGGRRVALQDWTQKREWKLESTAINFPIQGTGGDLKNLGFEAIRPYVKDHGVRFGWDMHDAIFAYLPESEAHDLALEIQQVLSNLDYTKLNGWEPKLELPVDCKLGHTWPDLEELNGWEPKLELPVDCKLGHTWPDLEEL